MFGGREAHGKVPRTVVVKPELLTHSYECPLWLQFSMLDLQVVLDLVFCGGAAAAVVALETAQVADVVLELYAKQNVKPLGDLSTRGNR